MVAAKSDCTGQRFGMLEVLGKEQQSCLFRGRTVKKWVLLCDCGTIIKLVRSDFDRPNMQRSCGCLGKNRKGRVDNKRRPHDHAGKQFGNLLVLKIADGLQHSSKPVWECRCDCGNKCNIPARHLIKGDRLNCGGENHRHGLKYPLMPSPMPDAVQQLISQFLKYIPTHQDCKYKNQSVEDEKMDRLIRAAWILCHREWQGENLSDIFKNRFIFKYLRYADIAIGVRELRLLMCRKADPTTQRTYKHGLWWTGLDERIWGNVGGG